MDITINGRTYRNAFVYLLGPREECSADIYTHGTSNAHAPEAFHTVDVRNEGADEPLHYTWNSSETVSPADYDRLMGPEFHGSVDIG